MYHQDWIMRQITSFIHMIGKVLFKKDSVELNIHGESNSEKVHLLYERLINLINNLKVNEAEDLLFENIETNDLIYIKIAMDFYDKVNKLSDEELEEADFSREEIKLGLEDILRLYSIKFEGLGISWKEY
ncbi:hypothetical protein KQI38_12290 [Tissierella carlieri]|uniref:DUF6483 family protein n=1 Tax=Tissierella TaxID=41273 RepID=UPI000BA11909|nr:MULTISPECIES: DUF6483 family protein [Tissierella]MBU5312815.1 hypothetical protein [Tissierella carlieri]OZV13773.1 hypothetical protein CIW83_02200 [Tissierella sp. P1]